MECNSCSRERTVDCPPVFPTLGQTALCLFCCLVLTWVNRKIYSDDTWGSGLELINFKVPRITWICGDSRLNKTFEKLGVLHLKQMATDEQHAVEVGQVFFIILLFILSDQNSHLKDCNILKRNAKRVGPEN